MIYLSSFSLSCIFAFFAEKNKNKFLSFFFTFLAIILLAILGGGRDKIIGTDVLTYVMWEFESNCTFKTLSDFINGRSLEFGYSLLNFCVTRFTDDYHFFLFISSVIMYSCFIIGIFTLSKRYNISSILPLLIFLLFFYNYSFNAVRQCIAMSILFAASYFLINRNFYIFSGFVIIATLFHSSGIIGFFIYHIYGYLYNKLSRKFNIFKYICYVSIFFLFFSSLVIFFMNFGILPTRFSRYFTDNPVDVGGSLVGLSKLPMLIFSVFCFYKIKINNELKPFIFFCFLDFLLGLSKMWYGAVSRLSDYFCIFEIILYPYLIKNIFEFKSRYIVIFCSTLLFVVYWIYTIFVKNYHDTFPYIWSWSFF